MKHIEKIKFWSGITLVFFAVLGGLIFYLESFDVIDALFKWGTSSVWRSDSGGSMTPVFLGLCAIGGAILLGSVKVQSEINIKD